MEPLIEIKTVPISIEYKVTAAKLQQRSAMAEVEISRNKGGLSIKSRPVKVNIDTFEARNSISPSPRTSIEQAAQRGKRYAYDATARFAQEGEMMLDIHLQQDPIPELAAQRGMETGEFNMEWLPGASPEISWEPAELNIRYEMDKLNFDWKTGRQNLEFIPASIEFRVAERPEVVINYIGGPIYVPPSADPDYEPIDVKA